MIATLQTLLNFCQSPLESLEQHNHKAPTAAVVAALVCITLATITPLPFTIAGLVYMFFFCALCILVCLFIFSVTYDFTAQLLGKTAQTLNLSKWLLLCGLPSILLVPLFLLQLSASVFLLFIIAVLELGINLYIYRLQFVTVKTLYSLSTKQTWVVLLSPFIAIVSLAVLLLIITLALALIGAL